MTYSRRNSAEEQQEARQKAKQITAICEKLSITLDPVDWQNSGLQASVMVDTIKIGELLDFGQMDSDSILRRVQIKLFEHAALETIHARPGLKALMWSPVDVVQPQEFLSLWIITMETDERVPIAEYIRDGQRIYEYYELNVNDGQQLAQLFGPAQNGEFHLGETVTIEEHQRKYTGEIIYILSHGKVTTSRKYSPRGSQSLAGKAYMNDASSRYLVDCKDGFPHLVNQSQIALEVQETVNPSSS